MLNQDERGGWLEAIKELKAQYYIGSQPAFQYLKAVRWLEQVRLEIIEKNPSLRHKHDLTIRWLGGRYLLPVEMLYRMYSKG